jgi:Tfp pilus assembly protein PilO
MFFGNKLGRNWSAVAFVFVMLLALSGALIVGYQKSVTGSAVSSVEAPSAFSEMLGLLILILLLGGIMTSVITAVLHRFGKSKAELSSKSVSSFRLKSDYSYSRSLDDLSRINAQLDELNRNLKDVDRKL